MAKFGLKTIDAAAAKKGKGVNTLWQFVKFIVVSLGAMIVQFALLNILKAIPAIDALREKDFVWFVFKYLAPEEGLGYFIEFNVANIVAQIVAFFINREKTFNSGANIAIVLPIYIVFTVFLICFSAWLSPTLNSLFMTKLHWGDTLSMNAATMICSAIQFFLYFPVDKILFHKKKGDKKAKTEETEKTSTETTENA